MFFSLTFKSTFATGATRHIMSHEPFLPPVTAAWQAAPLVNGEIPAAAFLEAAAKFVPSFDRLGTIFSPVKSDVGGNVKKLNEALAAHPGHSTLHQLVLAEKAAGKHKDKNGAATALLWFKRSVPCRRRVSTILPRIKLECFCAMLQHTVL